MCLDTKGTFKPCKTGYKVLAKRQDGSLHSGLCGNLKPQPLRLWLKEEDYRGKFSDTKLPIENNRIGENPDFYPTGWHIFHTLQAARECIYCISQHGRAIVEVEVSEPMATGYQDSRRVTVAKKIKILRVVAEKS